MNQMTESLSGKLAELLGGRFLTGDAIGADFCHDELPNVTAAPDAVCVVESTEEVSAVLRLCHEAGVPVTVRGAGTGKVGGSVPVNGGVVLSVKEMAAVAAVDENAKTITVQPGVLLQDVKAEAAKHGLYYPPDPGEKTATIGGNASTNAGGPCAAKYGSTRDYVLDAVIVLADGTVAKLSDKEEYAAVIGSEGTLAVITELTLKLVEKPAKDVILLFPFMDVETCINAAVRIQAEGYAPAVCEYLDTDIVEFSGNVTGNPVFPVELDGDRVGATLMVTLEGESDDELDEKMEALAELSEELECLDILVCDSLSLKRDAWDAHDAFHTSMEAGAKCSDELNITVPAENMAAFVESAKELGEEKGLKVLCYGHVCSGGLHVHACFDGSKDEFAPLMAEFAGAMYAKCVELGGCIRGEYGIGCGKKDYLKAVNPARVEELAARKAAFDPAGILNPGKVVSDAAVEVKTVEAPKASVEVVETPKADAKEKTAEPAAEAPAASAPAGKLKILCCVKQVPDVDQMRMDPETGLLVRAGVPAILNPQDANALSAAMKVKETYGAEITLITMGPPAAEQVLRECLAVGADKAVLITDRAFGNADTLATSYSILSAANTQDKYDMIFCGKESLDGATGQMGAQLAERFGTVQVTSTLLIREVNASAGTAVVDRELDDGVETLEVKLPCLFTMEKVNYPARIPNLKGKMAAKKIAITTITSNDIPGLDRNRIGDPGSPTKVPRMFPPVMPEPGVILDEGSVEANVAKLLGLIND